MANRFPFNQWQELSDKYDLPLSLIGYLSKSVINKRHKTLKVFDKFLETHYSKRKEQAKIKFEERLKIQKLKAIMFWKLCLGNPNKVFEGKNSLPDKSRIATSSDWQIEQLPNDPNDVSNVPLNLVLSNEELEILRRGHIPEVQEDHWFMYCDEQYIRYYRSWTGMCAFVAHYEISENGYKIDNLKMNRALVEFGVNGDDTGIALFKYLLMAETGGDSETAWQHYLSEWERLNKKYNQNNLHRQFD